MENGHDWRIAELTKTSIPDAIRSTSSDGGDEINDLFQVMRAVEAAEATIKQHVEENLRLRYEIEHKTLELLRRKIQDSMATAAVGSQIQLTNSDNHKVTAPISSDSATPAAADNGRLSSPLSQSEEGEQREYNDPPRFNSQLNDHGGGGDIVVRIQDNEQEIMQLRRQLADYSIKEAKIRKEKYALESRIAHMRLVYDQQQQDLAEAASKALAYRHDIIEENIRLAYALQNVQLERLTFVSSLMPMLADYSLQPQVHDAQSIASSVKILFRHLHEKLIMTESKLKQFQYVVIPWQSNSDKSNSNMALQSPSHQHQHSIGAALEVSNRHMLEMVTKPSFSVPVSPPAAQMQQTSASTCDQSPNWYQSPGPPSGSVPVETRRMEENVQANRNPAPTAVPAKPTIARLDANRYESASGKHVKFEVPERPTHTDSDDHEEEYYESGETSPDASSSYPRILSPVHENLFSDEDDPLPAIEGVQISGEAMPGHELQASGYSINGTTTCNFEWVRHLPDGSVNYIEGAKQPSYLLTADDVDTYLAIEVQPLDDRKRKGELVKVFANEHKKITCNPEMQSQIQKILQKCNASFRVFEFTGYLDIWEPATLTIKRGAYSIKRTSEGGVVVAEKFSPNTVISIPYGTTADFIISDSNVAGSDADHYLKTDDASCPRDTLVLILRIFILRHVERRTKKKRVLFF